MSDAPGGPGWWQASDGKWYPPDARPAPPAPPPEQPSKTGAGCILVAVAVAFVAIAGFIVFALVRDDGSGPGGKADASAELACRHFRNVAADYSAGHLTLAELRTKLREVNDDAQYSDEPGIAVAASGMLAALTAGDMDDLATKVTAMGRACDRAGL